MFVDDLDMMIQPDPNFIGPLDEGADEDVVVQEGIGEIFVHNESYLKIRSLLLMQLGLLFFLIAFKYTTQFCRMKFKSLQTKLFGCFIMS